MATVATHAEATALPPSSQRAGTPVCGCDDEDEVEVEPDVEPDRGYEWEQIYSHRVFCGNAFCRGTHKYVWRQCLIAAVAA